MDETLQELLGAVVEYLGSLDPKEGAKITSQAQTEIARGGGLVAQVGKLRTRYYRRLLADGWTMEEIAELCQITTSRVEQIANRR